MNLLRTTVVPAICLMIISATALAQMSSLDESYKISDIKKNAQIQSDNVGDIEISGVAANKKKSPALAALYSLILPGAGHWYLDRMDVGKYFLGADAIAWTGLITLNIHGDNVADDARSFSVEHAQVTSPDSRNKDYFANVGNYNNIYEYNNDKLSRGEYSLLYDVNSQFWNWDSKSNRDIFESQRKKSERIYNNRIIFSSLLIVNRIASGISAYLIANSSTKAGGFAFTPSVKYKKDMSFDGIEMNISRNF